MVRVIKTNLKTGDGDPCAGQSKFPVLDAFKLCSCEVTIENFGTDDPTGSKQ